MLGIAKLARRHFGKILLLAIGILVGGYISGAVLSVREIFFPQTTAHVRSTRTIINAIHSIGTLVTVSAEVDKADVRVEINDGILNAGYYSASHVAIGVIEAGIDFTAIEEDKIVFDSLNERYILTLPPPNLTSCRIEYIDQYSGSLTLLPADWDMVRQIAQHEAIALFVQDILEAGILERAEEETAIRLGEFLNALTGKPAIVEIESARANPGLPPSCRPEPPPGWEKDQSGAWKRTN